MWEITTLQKLKELMQVETVKIQQKCLEGSCLPQESSLTVIISKAFMSLSLSLQASRNRAHYVRGEVSCPAGKSGRFALPNTKASKGVRFSSKSQ